MIGWLSHALYLENRGWTSGAKRKYTDAEEQRVVTIKKELIDSGAYFLGSSHVQMHYNTRYLDDPLPSLWFIDEAVRRHKLQTHDPKKREKGKGVVEKLLYPIQSIVTLGRLQQSCDFIGKKFLAGRTEPISIFGTSYYQFLKLYQIRRVGAETSESAVRFLTTFWKTFPLPDVMRMDNGMMFRGTGRAEAHIGMFLKFLLNLGITPLFSAAYQSYTNPHIEGHNRTFTQKLWAQHFFTSLEEIDRECERFNAESKTFYLWKFKERLAQKSLRYLRGDYTPVTDVLRSTKGKKVCFLRFVEPWSEEQHRYGFVIFNRFIEVPSVYNNQYVFAVLDLATATLYVYSEKAGSKNEIVRQPFPFTL